MPCTHQHCTHARTRHDGVRAGYMFDRVVKRIASTLMQRWQTRAPAAPGWALRS